MSVNTERLLRLVADYHSFCSDEDAMGGLRSFQEEELSEDDLELVAAAQADPWNPGKDLFRNRSLD